MRKRNITKEQVKAISDFLNQHKALVGLSDYGVFVEERILESDDANIQVESDPLEKTLVITSYRQFFQQSEEKQQKDLLHELVHARIDIMDQVMKRHQSHIEEDCVNDLTNGIWLAFGKSVR